jgi:hypothetical protein
VFLLKAICTSPVHLYYPRNGRFQLPFLGLSLYTEGDSKFGILAKPALADFQMKN